MLAASVVWRASFCPYRLQLPAEQQRPAMCVSVSLAAFSCLGTFQKLLVKTAWHCCGHIGNATWCDTLHFTITPYSCRCLKSTFVAQCAISQSSHTQERHCLFSSDLRWFGRWVVSYKSNRSIHAIFIQKAWKVTNFPIFFTVIGQ